LTCDENRRVRVGGRRVLRRTDAVAERRRCDTPTWRSAGAAVAGAAVGTDAITGFPTIWAQEIKDIELRHVSMSYSVVKAIWCTAWA
jgi:putative spermidine/putrescine transport system substrate-binding protein